MGSVGVPDRMSHGPSDSWTVTHQGNLGEAIAFNIRCDGKPMNGATGGRGAITDGIFNIGIYWNIIVSRRNVG